MRAISKAFAYLRVSGKAQVEGDGFERQLLACQQAAHLHHCTIVEVFRDEGVSGTKELDNRPALSELFAALEENGIKTVIIEKLDRLARDLMVQETIIADMQKQGYILISVAEPDLCSDDPSRKLMRQIFGAIAEYDRAMIVLKLRGARQRTKARHGRCEGQKPFGHYEGEDAVLAEMRRMRGQGMYHKDIAAALAARGIHARSGGAWSGAVIARILRRAVVTAENTHSCADETITV